MTKKTVDALSFEEAMAELEKIVRALESGSEGLEASMTAYERGIALKKYCEDKLKDAQMRIEKISVAPGGGITTTPFDPSSGG